MTALFVPPKPPKAPKIEIPEAPPAAAPTADMLNAIPKDYEGIGGSVSAAPVSAVDEAATTLKPRRKLVGVR